MAAGLRWYLRPLSIVNAPVDEVVFTLLLSLRFTAVVFEETRNISLGLAARGVDWRALGFKGTLGLFNQMLGRLLDSLFASSAAVADAVAARSFRDASRHRFSLETPRRPPVALVGDAFALACLVAFIVHFSDFGGAFR